MLCNIDFEKLPLRQTLLIYRVLNARSFTWNRGARVVMGLYRSVHVAEYSSRTRYVMYIWNIQEYSRMSFKDVHVKYLVEFGKTGQIY